MSGSVGGLRSPTGSSISGWWGLGPRTQSDMSASGTSSDMTEANFDPESITEVPIDLADNSRLTDVNLKGNAVTFDSLCKFFLALIAKDHREIRVRLDSQTFLAMAMQIGAIHIAAQAIGRSVNVVHEERIGVCVIHLLPQQESLDHVPRR